MTTGASKVSFDSTYCTICLVGFSGMAPAQQHYISKRHQQKAMIAKLANEREPDGTCNSPQLSCKVFCKTCNISCDTKQMLDEHELTSKHLTALEKRNNHIELNVAADEFIILPGIWQRDIPKLTSVACVSNGNDSMNIFDNSKTSENNAITLSVPLNSSQLNNSELSSLHSEPICSLSINSDEEKEYEFTAYGRGTCHACNVNLTSVRMTKEHIMGQKHQNAKRHWLMKRQCDLRSKRNDQNNGISLTSDNPFSAALGIADPLSPSCSTPPGAENEKQIVDTRTESNVPIAKSSDERVIPPPRRKQSPCDKTTWFTCPICIKKCNSEKMLNAHVNTHGPGRYREVAREVEVRTGTEEQVAVLTVDLNSSVLQEAIEQGIRGRKESIAIAPLKKGLDDNAIEKTKIYARNGFV